MAETINGTNATRAERALNVAATIAVAGLVGLRLAQRMKRRPSAEHQPLSVDAMSSLRASHERATKLLSVAAVRGYADDEQTPRVAMWFSPSLEKLITVNDLVVGRRGENFRHIKLIACQKREGTYYMASPITDPAQGQPRTSGSRLDISWGVIHGAPDLTNISSSDIPVSDALAAIREALETGDLESVDFTARNSVWDS